MYQSQGRLEWCNFLMNFSVNRSEIEFYCPGDNKRENLLKWKTIINLPCKKLFPPALIDVLSYSKHGKSPAARGDNLRCFSSFSDLHPPESFPRHRDQTVIYGYQKPIYIRGASAKSQEPRAAGARSLGSYFWCWSCRTRGHGMKKDRKQ